MSSKAPGRADDEAVPSDEEAPGPLWIARRQGKPVISGTTIDTITPPLGRPAYGQTAIVLRTTAFTQLRSTLEAAGARYERVASEQPELRSQK